MESKKIRDLLAGNWEGEVTYVKGTDIESVEPSRDELLLRYSGYDLIINPGRSKSAKEAAESGRTWKKIDSLIKGGRFDSVSEALDYVRKEEEDAPLSEKLGIYTDDITLHIFDTAESFVDSREAQLRKAMLPYIEAMLIAGMRAKLLACVWVRLELYGFSAAPFNWEEGESFGRKDLEAFPYTSVQEMTKKDREALEKAALDVYYEVGSGASLFQLWNFKKWIHDKGVEQAERSFAFKPYPKDGLGKAELAALHREDDSQDEDEIYSSLYDSWETETEVYLPILYYRYDEAVYYAMKYSGDEYRKYLSSLNAAEDWDFMARNNGDEYSYNNVMKEGGSHA